MFNTLYGPAFLLHLTMPLISLGGALIQFKVIGSRRTSLMLICASLVWGIVYLGNPFHVMWLPNSLYDPNTYAVYRGAVVLLYIALVVFSIIRKSFAMQVASIFLLVVVVADLLWSHLDGRYAGP